jgi:hypothetical protein
MLLLLPWLACLSACPPDEESLPQPQLGRIVRHALCHQASLADTAERHPLPHTLVCQQKMCHFIITLSFVALGHCPRWGVPI